MIQTSKTRAGRDPALDIIRICAFLFVVSVHFFLKCGYYDVCVSGRAMYLATFLRQFLMICVPLFMMLTGYLTGDRKPAGIITGNWWTLWGCISLRLFAARSISFMLDTKLFGVTGWLMISPVMLPHPIAGMWKCTSGCFFCALSSMRGGKRWRENGANSSCCWSC